MRYDLDQIETFLAVMELGTVTAAAARLNLSKSVISKRITDFEAVIGAALFKRNAGRITPTEAAIRLAERLRPALSELVAATESAAWGMDGAASLRGSLAIAAPMTFGTMYLTPILARFAAAHPALELRVDYEDRPVVVASPDYLARAGTPKTPAELADHPIIGYSHVPNAQIWQFNQGSRMVSPAVKGRLTLNNGEAIRDMAVAGLGLAMLPGFIVAPALADGSLVQVLPHIEPRPLPIMAVWPPVSPMPIKLRMLVDYLAAELAVPGWRIAP